MVLDILKEPDDRLHTKSIDFDIEKEKDNIISLISNLRDTVKLHEGVGIAAPQVAIFKKLFIANDKVFINPKLYFIGSKKISSEEGCLSVSNQFLKVKRFQKIKIEYINESFEQKTEIIDGFDAIVIQHEYDHLLGKTIVSR